MERGAKGGRKKGREGKRQHKKEKNVDSTRKCTDTLYVDKQSRKIDNPFHQRHTE